MISTPIPRRSSLQKLEADFRRSWHGQLARTMRLDRLLWIEFMDSLFETVRWPHR
jgi:hypothetical protein